MIQIFIAFVVFLLQHDYKIIKPLEILISLLMSMSRNQTDIINSTIITMNETQDKDLEKLRKFISFGTRQFVII